MPVKYFVWVEGLNGPEPQLWHEDQMDGNSKAKKTLAKHKLEGGHEDLPLNVLAKLYPYEAKL